MTDGRLYYAVWAVASWSVVRTSRMTPASMRERVARCRSMFQHQRDAATVRGKQLRGNASHQKFAARCKNGSLAPEDRELASIVPHEGELASFVRYLKFRGQCSAFMNTCPIDVQCHADPKH